MAGSLIALVASAGAQCLDPSMSSKGKDEMPSFSDKGDYSRVGDLLDQLVASKKLPGASALVLRDGRQVYYHQTGMQDVETDTPVERDTLFRIFSMTKPVTAASIMVLVDDGTLRLDDPVSKYVPELSNLGVFAGSDADGIQTLPAGTMTIRNLLTHTAGFTYWFQPQFTYWDQAKTPVAALYDTELGAGRFEPWRFDPEYGGLDGLAAALARVPLLSQPGEKWHYSLALEVAGLVVERASGETLDAFMKARIFDPLDMGDTGFQVAPDDAARLASVYATNAFGGIEVVEKGMDSPLLQDVPGLSGGGGLVSTIDDYARFADMLRNGGELDGHRVLSSQSVKDMMTNQLKPEQLDELPLLALFGLGGNGDGMGFGLGGAVVVDAEQAAAPAPEGEYSWGGAASTTFWVDPANGLVVVFMTQLIPPSNEMLRDKLHVAIYGADSSGSCDP